LVLGKTLAAYSEKSERGMRGGEAEKDGKGVLTNVLEKSSLEDPEGPP